MTAVTRRCRRVAGDEDVVGLRLGDAAACADARLETSLTPIRARGDGLEVVDELREVSIE